MPLLEALEVRRCELRDVPAASTWQSWVQPGLGAGPPSHGPSTFHIHRARLLPLQLPPGWPGPSAPVSSEPRSVGKRPLQPPPDGHQTVKGSSCLPPGGQAPGATCGALGAAASSLCFLSVSAVGRTEHRAGRVGDCPSWAWGFSNSVPRNPGVHRCFRHLIVGLRCLSKF